MHKLRAPENQHESLPTTFCGVIRDGIFPFAGFNLCPVGWFLGWVTSQWIREGSKSIVGFIVACAGRLAIATGLG